MENKSEKLDELGKLLIDTLKNETLYWFNLKCTGEGIQSSDRIAHRDLSALPTETVDIIKDAVNEVVSSSIVRLLGRLWENWEDEEGISLLVDGENVFDIDDDVRMKFFGENGWDARFSNYPSYGQLIVKYDKWYNKLRREGQIED